MVPFLGEMTSIWTPRAVFRVRLTRFFVKAQDLIRNKVKERCVGGYFCFSVPNGVPYYTPDVGAWLTVRVREGEACSLLSSCGLRAKVGERCAAAMWTRQTQFTQKCMQCPSSSLTCSTWYLWSLVGVVCHSFPLTAYGPMLERKLRALQLDTSWILLRRESAESDPEILSCLFGGEPEALPRRNKTAPIGAH